MHEEEEMNSRHRNNIDRWRGVSRPVVGAAAVRVSLLGARISRHERRPLAVNRRAGTPVRRTALPITHGCLATQRDQGDKASQGTRETVVTNVVGCHDHPAAAALVSDASRGGGTGQRHGSAHRVLSHMPLALYAAAAEEKCFQVSDTRARESRESLCILLMLPIASSP